DNIAMYRAWNPEFFAMMQRMYPEKYADADYKQVFFEWKAAYHADWPDWLIEPESEEVKVEQTKLEGVVSVLDKFLEQLDPDNKTKVLQWAADTISENKKIFPYALTIDFELLKAHQEEQKEQEQENMKAQQEAMRNGT